MEPMPKWVLPPTGPSVYDTQSGTALEMVAKVYGAMSTLVNEYNAFADQVNKSIESHTNSETAAREGFENELRDYMNKFTCGTTRNMEKFMRETGEKIKNPDWSQNEPTALDYIKNRTHYEETLVEQKKVEVKYSLEASVTDKIYEQRTTAVFTNGTAKCTYIGDIEGTKGFYLQHQNGKTIEVTPSSDGLYCKYQGENVSPVVYVTYQEVSTVIHKIDEKYLPLDGYATETYVRNYHASTKDAPLLLDASSAETYLEYASYGDAALAAIMSGRQILVKVPNADGGNYTAIYSPILMYQVPNYANQYLYLFFLRDEKQDLSALLGQAAGTVVMPTYGQIKLLLSQEYNSDPLVNL